MEKLGVIMDLQPLSSTEYIILEEIMCQQFLVVLICLFMASHGHSLRRRCRNRREIRYCMSVRVPKIISHLHSIINDNDSVCIDKLRMDRNAFHTLVLLTKDIGRLTDSKSMSSSEKLAMFLNILAHHEKNRSIKVDYIRSGWSVSQAFNECLSAILKLTPLLLVDPKPVLEDEIEDRWKWFKGCLGALDGIYIQIRVPSQYKPRYRTRKGEIATNVLGVCDRNLNFTYVLPGWEGSAADDRVLRDAVARRNGLKIHEGMPCLCFQVTSQKELDMKVTKLYFYIIDNYYLCDGGYTNGKGFLSPYRGYRYWLKDWQGDNPLPRCKEELFNMRHARARNVIERTFGLLKGRWGILRSSSWYSVKVHNRIISACCLIHNFIRREMEVDPLDIDMEEQMEYQHENIDIVESSQEWTTWRDELAQSMWNARSNN
uniref:Uncharacterized protein LOC104247567 isoform X1 n=1 Tax=Nicotiana sylvestris TaxID=4096 RepID=A0A1U7YRS2_NICSY|nr:PREDICTED: uncharacterized protein LOC104247567 isoform X1 [Nicotiana sylvestris]XP_009801919.1 PREDICTED: uncharacterized protein LOC104247567 isoform X1 [Nicotiana sylvestris]